MKICDNCKGDGLVGGGDQPHLRQGAISTCPICAGTGKIADEGSLQEPSVDLGLSPVNEAEKKTEDSSNDSSIGEPYTGPMLKIKVTGVAHFTNEVGEVSGDIEIGSTINLPAPIAQTFIDDGVAEIVE